MIAHSNTFKEAITTLGRDIHVRIQYYSIVYNLETEDEKLIITQDNMELLTEPIEGLTPSGLLGDEDIMNLNRNNLGELFRTYMKSFDLETTHRFNVGDKMLISVGTTTGEDTIEYLNYGKYFVYQRTYNEDTKTYTYTLCDSMLFTMIPYDNDAVFDTDTEITCETAISRILTLCGLTANVSGLVNGTGVIYLETFEGADMTYRDVLDMIMQSQGCSLLISYNDEQDTDVVITKSFNSQSVDTIDEDILADKNIKTGDKFGKINSLLFKRANGNDNIEVKDDASIEANGLCQYIIENNYILDQENRQDYINNLYNKIKDIEYYTCNVDCTGLGYIEYMDTFTIQTPDGLYNCLCLKNTSNISNGMKENFTTEAPIEKKREYGSTALSDKDAQILVNKLKGEIVLKTYQDDGVTKIAQVRLDSSGDAGSLVEISADQIDLTGKNINLTGDDITISSNNFNVDTSGNVVCNSATMNDITINKGQIDLAGSYSSAKLTLTNSSDSDEKITFSPRQTYFKNRDGSQYILIQQNTSGQSTIQSNIGLSNWFSLDAGSLVITRGSTNSTIYGDSIYTPVLYQTSKESNKKDFEELDSGLDIIKNIDIYRYHLKDQDEYEKKHIGFVIGDNYKYSNELTNNENESVDLYSFISVCCKAIQEQQEQIEELKKEIDNLKGGNK